MYKYHSEELKDMNAFGLSMELYEHIETLSLTGRPSPSTIPEWSISSCVNICGEIRPYMLIYHIPNMENDGYHPYIHADKIARISMIKPEYIMCSDSSKGNWILNHKEKIILCDLFNSDKKLWSCLIGCMENCRLGFSGEEFDLSYLERIKIPDYMQLSEE